MAGLVIWLSRLRERTWLRGLAWAALGANIVQDLLGLETGSLPAPVRISHALLGQLFFSTTVAIAVFTSKGWSQTPKPIENASLLRFLALTTPTLVLLQVILGTELQHGVMGTLPHIFGALVVAVFLGPAMAVQQPEVRPAAIALTVTATLQILLGFALLTMESLEMDPLAIIIATVAHAAMGAFTLAAAVVMAILICRVICAASPHRTGESASPLVQTVHSHEPRL
jgi:heme A synthase